MTSRSHEATARRRAEAAFHQAHGQPPELLVRAPGRVNVIGEHTDYNEGFVLPAAIDRELWIALRGRPDARVGIRSVELGAGGTFDLTRVDRGGGADWIEYVKGAAWVLQDGGRRLRGWDGVVASDVPVGAGLSSSAALEMAVLCAFSEVSALPWAEAEAASLGKRVENEWIGVWSGIMDQLAVAAGRRDHALLIDCRSLEVEPVGLPPGVCLVVLDTGTRRGLVGSAYNERRQQCDEAARQLGVPALRDAAPPLLEARRGALDPVVHRRARHVVTENARTLEAAAALRAGDVARLGALMDASHASLRDDFEVSTDALDTMVELAGAQDGCLGARMTGAGFGGCAIALVEKDLAGVLTAEVSRGYRDATALQPTAYVCRAADGVSVERRR